MRANVIGQAGMQCAHWIEELAVLKPFEYAEGVLLDAASWVVTANA
ncbi:MAG: hypothetical protein AAF542_01310 [Pseudomonadota bacterium]